MESLTKKLSKLVYDYSINKKYADIKFVETALFLCIDAFDVKDYVKKISISTIEDKDVYAGYNIENKEVVIDINSCIISALDRIKIETDDKIKSTEFLNYVKVNLNVINGIIHELTHACQYKKSLDKEEDIEKKILYLTLDRNIRVFKGEKLTFCEIQYYKRLDQLAHEDLYYIATPSERMANLKALEYENNIGILLPTEEKDNLDNYTELRLLMGQMQAYQNISPTTFIKSVNETIKKQYGLPYNDNDVSKIEKAYKELAKENNLTLSERIFLGLPIEKVEKQKINKKINKLSSRIR